MRSLLAIQHDIRLAKKRLAQLRSEEYQILLKYPCRGCGMPVGHSCVKVGSRQRTASHNERVRDAEDAVFARAVSG
jgi:hypothetical protein